MPKVSKALTLIAASFLCSVVQAESVTYQFSATVTELYDITGAVAGAVNVGDTITGTYTVDTNTPNTALYSYGYQYMPQGPAAGMTLSFGGHAFNSQGSCLGTEYYNLDPGPDYYSVWVDNYNLPDCQMQGTNPELTPDFPSLQMVDYNGTAVDGLDINSLPDLWAFQERNLWLGNTNYYLRAELNSLELQPASTEPPTEPVAQTFVSPASGTVILPMQNIDFVIGVHGQSWEPKYVPYIRIAINGKPIPDYDFNSICYFNGSMPGSVSPAYDEISFHWVCPQLLQILGPGTNEVSVTIESSTVAPVNHTVNYHKP